MIRNGLLAATLLALLTASARAEEKVAVPGSDVKYDSTILCRIGDKDLSLVLTGTALRKKLFVNVYAIGSYLEQGVRVQSAEELAAKDAAKQLHLVMERNVSGDDMAKAFKEALRLNYPGKEFEGELAGFASFLQENPAKKGDLIVLTHAPGTGFRCTIAEKVECQINNPAFSRAIWEIYLGKNNLGESIKRGLVGRLK
jgi:hypothetical protein